MGQNPKLKDNNCRTQIRIFLLQFTRHGSCVLFWFCQIIFNICIVQIVFKYRQIQFVTYYLRIKKRGTIPHYLTVEGVLGC